MLKKGIYILVFMFSFLGFAQNYSKHTVLKGETLSSIAQKYKVTPYDIYNLNPDAQNGIKLGSVLLIPKSIGQTTVKPVVQTGSTKIHEVKPKETLYSISKQYNVTVEDIQKNNSFLAADGLQPGQKLVISSKIVKSDATKKPVENKVAITHEVLPKETKYGIATKYGITVDQLEAMNPEVKENLPIGYKLKITKNQSATSNSKEVKDTNQVYGEVQVKKADKTFDYTVKKGETMYSLPKTLGVSEQKLRELNPILADGLKDGMILKIPSTAVFNSTTTSQTSNLLSSLNKKDKKELVLFLPFNIAKFESDSLSSTTSKLKNDKFLNMTLDFYSGALMAIDSAKTLGLNVDVRIFDSNENKYNTDAVEIAKAKAMNASAIIGPFYSDNAEKLAEAMQEKNIPVISPLSKDYEVSYPNLYQSFPTTNSQKNAIFNFMNAKNGNIIAIVDPKKESSRKYLQEFQKDTKLVGFSDKGGFVSDSITKLLVKDKMNYVILESEREGTVFTVTTVLSTAKKDYQVQLVILEPNATLDFEEISVSKLTKLNLLFPSASKDNVSTEASNFEMNYKKINKVLPNAYATRGFDVTFDTLLRLSQGKSFEETMNTTSEQVENKFDYAKSASGGYINKGIYILEYQEDLTVKEAK